MWRICLLLVFDNDSPENAWISHMLGTRPITLNFVATLKTSNLVWWFQPISTMSIIGGLSSRSNGNPQYSSPSKTAL